MPERPAPDTCANCGAVIPRGAKACPACGADERTGWREQDVYDDLELPADAWDDGNTPPTQAARRTRDVNGLRWYWWCVAVGLLLMLILVALALR